MYHQTKQFELITRFSRLKKIKQNSEIQSLMDST